MNNKLKMGILTALCLFALSCGNGNGQSGKVLFESSDKKIKVYENEVNIELEKTYFPAVSHKKILHLTKLSK